MVNKIENGENTIRIIYRDKKVKNLCTNFNEAKKEFNVNVAEKLFAIINFLENADCLNDINALQIYHLHPLQGTRKGQFALDLGRRLGYRLIIIPVDKNGEEWKENDINVVYKATDIVIVWEVTNHYE